jgi:hypothetical protein
VALEPVLRAMRVTHERDPREEILDELGDLPAKVRIGGADVLIARYIRTGKIRHGTLELIQADQTQTNDKWQSVTGLILKMGPLAYRSEKTLRWYADQDGQRDPPKVGDWVLIDPKLGQMFHLGDRLCLLIPDQHIFMVLDEPDIVQ